MLELFGLLLAVNVLSFIHWKKVIQMKSFLCAVIVIVLLWTLLFLNDF